MLTFTAAFVATTAVVLAMAAAAAVALPDIATATDLPWMLPAGSPEVPVTHRNWFVGLLPNTTFDEDTFVVANAVVTQPSSFNLRTPIANPKLSSGGVATSTIATASGGIPPTSFAQSLVDESVPYAQVATTRMTVTWRGNFTIPANGTYSLTLFGCYKHDTTDTSVLGSASFGADANKTYIRFFSNATPTDEVFAQVPTSKSVGTACPLDGTSQLNVTLLVDSVALKTTYDSMQFVGPDVLAITAETRPELIVARFEIAAVNSSDSSAALGGGGTVYNRTAPHVVPGSIEAENYDVGGLGTTLFAYATPAAGIAADASLGGRSGFEHLNVSVASLKASAGTNRTVVALGAHRFLGLAYTIDVATAGIYRVEHHSQGVTGHVFSANFTGVSFHLGSSGSAQPASAGANATLMRGVQKLWLYVQKTSATSGDECWVDYLNATLLEAVSEATSGATPPQPNTADTAAAVPGIIQAAQYQAYAQSTTTTVSTATAAGNATRLYDRFTGASVNSKGGGAASGVYLDIAASSVDVRYTVNVTKAGLYTVAFNRVSSTSNFRVQMMLGNVIIVKAAAAYSYLDAGSASVALHYVYFEPGLANLTFFFSGGIVGDLESVAIGNYSGGAYTPESKAPPMPGFIPAWRYDHMPAASTSASASATVVSSIPPSSRGNWTASAPADRRTPAVEFDWSPTYEMPIVHDWSDGESFTYSVRRRGSGRFNALKIQVVLQCVQAGGFAIYTCNDGTGGCRDRVLDSTHVATRGGAAATCTAADVASLAPKIVTIQSLSDYGGRSTMRLYGDRNPWEFAIRIVAVPGEPSPRVHLIGMWLYSVSQEVTVRPIIHAYSPASVFNVSHVPEDYTDFRKTDPHDPSHLLSNGSVYVGAPNPYVLDHETGMPCLSFDGFGGRETLRRFSPGTVVLSRRDFRVQGTYDIRLWGRVHGDGLIGQLQAGSGAGVALTAPNGGFLSGVTVGSVAMASRPATPQLVFQSTNLVSVCAIQLRLRPLIPFAPQAPTTSAPSTAAASGVPHVNQDATQMYSTQLLTQSTAIGTQSLNFTATVPSPGTFYLVAYVRRAVSAGSTSPASVFNTHVTTVLSAADATVSPMSLRFQPEYGDIVQATFANKGTTTGAPLPYMVEETPVTLSSRGGGPITLMLSVTPARSDQRFVGFRLERAAGITNSPSSCLVKQTAAEICPMALAEANLTSCDIGGPFASVVPTVVPRPRAGDSSLVAAACAPVLDAATGERSTVITPPAAVGGSGASGVVLHLAREAKPLASRYAEFNASHPAMVPGDTLSNGRIELRIGANALLLFQVDVFPERQLHEEFFFGITKFLVTSEDLQVHFASGTRYYRGSSLRLEDCRALVYDRWNTIELSTNEQPLHRSAACKDTGGSPANRVIVTYVSGIVDRVAIMTRVPGVDLKFVPRNLSELTASNMSTCTKASRARTANFTNFPVLGLVPFRGGSELVAKVTIVNDDTIEQPVLLGATWVRVSPASSCAAVPHYGDTTPAGETIYGIRDGLVAIDSSSTFNQPDSFWAVYDTAHGCAVDGNSAVVGVARRTVSMTKPGGSATEVVPRYACVAEHQSEAGALTHATNPKKLVRGDFSYQAFFTNVPAAYATFPSTRSRLTLATGPFAPAAATGGAVQVMITSSTGKISVAGLTRYSVMVPAASLQLPQDWIAVVSPVTAHQCGRGLEPFNDPTVYGRLNPNTTTTCAANTPTGYVSCGETRLTSPVDGEIAIFTPAETAASKPCGEAFHAIIVFQGTLTSGTATVSTDVQQLFADGSEYLRVPQVALIGTVGTLEGFGFTARVNYDRVAPSIVTSGFYCEFADIEDGSFAASPGTAVAAGCTAAPQIETVGQLASLCAADTSCLGYTTLVSEVDGTDIPGCIASAGFTTGNATGITFWRRLGSERSCSWVAPTDYGQIVASAWQIDLLAPEHALDFSVNGQSIGACGGSRGFADANTPGQGLCSSVVTCLSQPAQIRRGDRVTVSIPSTMSSRGACDGNSAKVVVKFGKATPAVISMMATFANARPLRFNTLVPSSVTLRMNPTRAALSTPFNGCTHCGTTLSVRVGPVRSSSTASPRQQQQQQQQSSASAAETLIECGGRTSTAVPSCGDVLLCTTTASHVSSTLTPNYTVASRTALAETAEVTIEYTPPTNLTGNCFGSFFEVGLFTDGASTAAPAGGDVRSYFVDTTTADAAASRARVQALLPSLAPSAFSGIALPFTAPTTRQPAQLYDITTLDETAKTPTAGANPGNMTACVVDAFTSGIVGCRVPLAGSNFLVVSVLQTVYGDSDSTVKVRVGATTVTCGGGRTFRGEAGQSSQCATYAVCYSGPVSGHDSASIEMTPAAGTASTCPAHGVVVAETSVRRTVVPDGLCAADAMYCPSTAACVDRANLCDGTRDCRDGSDEAYCNGYRFVASNQAPSCATNATLPVPSSGVLEFNDCKLWAVAHQDRFASKPSFLFVENVLCVAYNCLSVDQPSTTLAPYTGLPGAELFAHLETIDDFKLCSADLHCSGRGIPASSVPPCACRCDEGFLGDACATQKTMATIPSIVVALKTAGIDGTPSTGVLAALSNGLGQSLPTGFSIATLSNVQIGDRTVLTMDALNPSANSQQQSNARSALLAPEARTRVVAQLAAAGAATELDELTAGNAFVSVATVVNLFQRKQASWDSMLFSSFGRRTEHATASAPTPMDPNVRRQAVNSYGVFPSEGFAPVIGDKGFESRTAPLPIDARIVKMTFTILGTHYDPATHIFTVDGTPCNSVALVTITNDGLPSGCSKRTVCTWYPPNATAVFNDTVWELDYRYLRYKFERSPATTPSKNCEYVVDTSFVGTGEAEPLQVDYTYTVPVATSNPRRSSASRLGEEITLKAEINLFEPSQETAMKTSVAVVLVLVLVVLLSCLCCCCHACSASRETDPMPRDVYLGKNCRCFTFGFAAAMGAVYFAALAMTDLVPKPTHYMVVDEYRTNKCDRSELTLAPARTSRVLADGACSKAQTLGAAEGALYLRARCTEGSVTGTFDGQVQVAFGDNTASCIAAPWRTVDTSVCYNESTIFSDKVASELQFLQFGCWESAAADARFKHVEAVLNPVPQPSAYVVPTPTPTQTSVLTAAGRTRVYHLTTPVEVAPVARGRDGTSLALAAFTNQDTSSAQITFANSGARFDTVVYVDPDNTTHPTTGATTAATGLSDQGMLFNHFGEPGAEVTGSAASLGAYRYQGMDSAEWFDIGSKLGGGGVEDAVTIIFWLKASARTRGFAFMVTDYWHERASFASPILQRLVELIESGRAGSAYFAEQWRGYYGMYVNGRAKTLHLLVSDPTNAAVSGGEVLELAFDATLPSVDAARVFDGDWHQIAVALPAYGTRRYAQLFVDGETSYTKEGWRQCFPTGRSIAPFTELNATVPVFQNAAEQARTRPVAYVGHLNGGVYNLEVHSGFLEQERVIGYGSDGMKRYAIIDADAANLLAYAMAAVFVVGLAATVGLLGCAMKRGEAEGTTDAAADSSKPMVAKGSKAASTRVSAIAAARGARGSTQAKHFVPNVLRVAQTMALYITGWRWPTLYTIGWEYIAIPLSLNLTLIGVDALVAPLVQFVAAMLLLIILIWVSKRDTGRFEAKVIGRALARRKAVERRLETGRLDNSNRPKSPDAREPFACHDDSGVVKPNAGDADAPGVVVATAAATMAESERDVIDAEAKQDNWPHPPGPSDVKYSTTFTLQPAKSKARKAADKAAKDAAKAVNDKAAMKRLKYSHLEVACASCTAMEECFVDAMAAASTSRPRVSSVVTLTVYPDREKEEQPDEREVPEPEAPDSDADVDVDALNDSERKAFDEKQAKKLEKRDKAAAKKLKKEEKIAAKKANAEAKEVAKRPPRELTGVVYIQSAAEKQMLKGKTESVRKAEEKAAEQAQKDHDKLLKAFDKSNEKRARLRATRKEAGEPESQSDDEPQPEEPKPVLLPKIKASEFAMTAFFVEGASPSDFADHAIRATGGGENATPFDIESSATAFVITPTTKWPILCPLHRRKLIRAVPEIHPKVHGTETGASPYICCNRARSQWHGMTDADRHVCFGIREEAFFVCPDDDCAFCVCESCNELGFFGGLGAKIRGAVYAAERTGAMGVIGVIIVTLLLLVFLPVMRSALMILTCHPEWQCEFPQCYADFSGLFVMAVVCSVLTVLGLGVFFFLYLVTSLVERKLYAIDSGVFDGLFKRDGVVDPEYKPEGTMAKLFADVDTASWLGLLEYDKTMLASLYDGYGFRWMCFVGPLDLVFKLALILPIILADPNTLTQLAGASAVESGQLLYFLFTNSFVNQWLNTLAQIGSLHQAVQLAFMALHRVAVNKDPDSAGYAWFMVSASSVYGAIMVAIFVRVVLAPAVADALATRRQLREDQYSADARAYRGGGLTGAEKSVAEASVGGDTHETTGAKKAQEAVREE